MPTAIIADDEDLQRHELRRMLSAIWPDLTIIAECEHGTQALEAIIDQKPDIAFLDIRMPGITGLDVAHATRGRCHAVFTTAYENYALKAYETGAIDYLLKPITSERLVDAVQRLKERLKSNPADLTQLMQVLEKKLAKSESSESKERIRWISASVGDTIKMFAVDKILFFTSDEKYTRVVTQEDEAHVRKPLKEIMDGLDEDEFWQVHRGSVVRASAIKRVHRDDAGKYTIELNGTNEKVKVSQAYSWRFKPM